jgi:septal ring factor EnvC (AmiA/AmiB activator)
MAVQRASISEVRREVEDLRDDTARIERRVDDHADKIGDLRESHARVTGEVTHLVRAYERAASVATTQALTELEVRKADALAAIRDRGLERKHRRAVSRELIFKAVTIAMGLWALVYSMLQARC